MSRTSQVTLQRNLPFTSNFPPLYTPNPTQNLAGSFKSAKSREELGKILAPGDLVQTVQEIVMFGEQAEAEGVGTSLGSPRMRTVWQLQSIEVVFSSLITMSRAITPPAAGKNGKLQIGALLRIGGRTYNFFLLEAPLTNFTSWTEKPGEILFGISVEYLRRRVYTLELFSPIEIGKAEDLQIAFTVKRVESGEQTPAPTIFIIEPEVIANISQTAP